jgi:hypothetical protein
LSRHGHEKIAPHPPDAGRLRPRRRRADNRAAPETRARRAGQRRCLRRRRRSGSPASTRAAGAQKNQLCIVEKGGEAQFGLIVWGGNLHSCSGAGRAVRSGERLSLRMTGDESCTIEASLKHGTIALPATLPAGCAYYCGARASLAGATFTRATEADARKATDIAGDPLCD